MSSRDDKAAIAGAIVVIGIWIMSVLLSLGLTGVIIWAIIELVQHFTA